MQKDAQTIKNYWNSRAGSDASEQSTTMDIWLRKIEANVVLHSLRAKKPTVVFDIGCGDGRTTIKCASEYPPAKYVGFDYAPNMIANSRENAIAAEVNNVEFQVGDVTQQLSLKRCEFAYTTRCLINLEDWGSQQKAIANIRDSLVPGGVYLMIENFIEGHELFNSLRVQFKLPEIPVRGHNTFFKRDILLDYLGVHFDVLSEENISSSYYLVSRIIYSSICAKEGVKPDYNDIHHQLAAQLPFAGEYGPVRAITLKKK